MEKRDQMRREKLMAEVSTEVGTPPDADVRTYYDTHPAEFRSGEEVHVRQILVHDESLANDILNKLRHGASFDDMSSQYSLAPNAKKGGDIGYVSRGELPKMFEDEIFNLKPGSISGPIRTESSFHIFRVDDRRPPGVIDVQTAAPVIREKLRDDAIRQRVAQLVARSRAEMQIAVLTKRLPFRYSGSLPKSDE
jgi:parvulin-like peptidyl-prolyl isomerase